MEFTFSDKAKRFTFILAGLGLLMAILGIVLDGSEHVGDRFWSNLLIDGFFFFAIALGALFFIALHYATETGWGAALLRVFMGVTSWLPIGAAILIVVFAASSLHLNHLYHWMAEGISDPTNHHFDEIIANKSAYLNKPFFWIRTAIYLAIFLFGAWWFKKTSLKEDEIGGTSLHFLMFKRGALFLVLFAVFSSSMSWDWIMSIDPHWYSTLFGWYIFSGMWVTAMIVVLLSILYLKSKGQLPKVNENHIHDITKWIFAVSFLWSYLWFSQFMLIWYANIPEEVAYFVPRLGEYKGLYLTMFLINFALPMVILMSRDAKRNPRLIATIASVLLVGHWVDVYMMVTPGTMFHNWHFGLVEWGMFILFLGLFMHVVLRAFTKVPLEPKNHPMLDESYHHEF